MGAKIDVALSRDPQRDGGESNLSRALDDPDQHLIGAILQRGPLQHDGHRLDISIHVTPPCDDPEHLLGFADALDAAAAEIRRTVKQ